MNNRKNRKGAVHRNVPNAQQTRNMISSIYLASISCVHVAVISHRWVKEFSFYTAKVYFGMERHTGETDTWIIKELKRAQFSWAEEHQVLLILSTFCSLRGGCLQQLAPGNCTWLLVQWWQHRAQHLLPAVFTQLLARSCSPFSALCCCTDCCPSSTWAS